MIGRLLLVAIIAITCTYAQEEGGGAGGEGGGGMGGGGRGGGDMGGGGGMGGMGGGMPRRLTKLEEFAQKLKINNKEQGPEVEKILTAAVQEAAPVRAQLDRGRLALTEAIVTKKGDDEFKKIQEAYQGLLVQLTAIEAKAFGQVLALLKDNQKSKAGQAFELLDGYFDENQAGGGRSGRMGGRGGRER